MVPLVAFWCRVPAQAWGRAQRHQVSLSPSPRYRCRERTAHLDRPANILLSNEDVPVLVDFGFAEKYDVNSSDAFHSNLSYGTPEVSPRRTSLSAPVTHYMRLVLLP